MAEAEPGRPTRRHRLTAWIAQHRTALLRWGAGAAALGLLLAGFGLGQLVLPRTVVAGDVIEVSQPAAETALDEVAMPDVVGMSEDAARQAIADAGAAGEVTTVAAPAAGASGLVVAQTPTGGSRSPSEIRLTLSEPAPMPDLSGLPVADARAQLEALGAVVRVTRVVRPDVAEDLVLSSVPEAAQPVPAIVDLAVADAGEALSLTSIRPVDASGCSSRSRSVVAGVNLEDSPACRAGSSNAFAEWSVSRRAAALVATVGLLDTGGTEPATLRIIGDGAVLSETTVAFGTSTEVRVDLQGVLRLRIEVSSAAGSDAPTLVLGDGRLLGSADDIAVIEAA